MIRFFPILVLLFTHAAVLASEVQASLPAGKGTYVDLIQLVEDFAAYREPSTDPGGRFTEDDQGRIIYPVIDYSDEALGRRRAAMAGFQTRIDDMNVVDWPLDQKVDWMAVRSRLNQQQFILDRFQHKGGWINDPNVVCFPFKSQQYHRHR